VGDIRKRSIVGIGKHLVEGLRVAQSRRAAANRRPSFQAWRSRRPAGGADGGVDQLRQFGSLHHARYGICTIGFGTRRTPGRSASAWPMSSKPKAGIGVFACRTFFDFRSTNSLEREGMNMPGKVWSRGRRWYRNRESGQNETRLRGWTLFRRHGGRREAKRARDPAQ
jgi:hypothetical protein